MAIPAPPKSRGPVPSEADFEFRGSDSEFEDEFDSQILAARRSAIPRVAFFTDSFHEANGVALTSRQFAGFAREHFYPFFSVHAGSQTAYWKRGNFETYELASSGMNLRIEHDLAFDLKFLRHRAQLRTALAQFKPDVVHVTGPSHLGILGAMLAKDLGVPLVASWHTNIHEYAGRRFEKTLRHLPKWLRAGWGNKAADWSERGALSLTLRFYQLAKVLFAPNPDLVEMLATKTRRPVHLMRRGIDIDLFHPRPSKEPSGSKRPFTIGYVGRLSAEKNVRILPEIDKILRAKGCNNYRYLIVGEGSEREWLRNALPDAELPGLLHGEALASAYAGMDTFVFPAETDTFGNVILEAMASGAPPVVSEYGGPKYLVDSGVSGYVAKQVDARVNKAQAYAYCIAALMADPVLHDRMASEARASALNRRWSTVFEGVYQQYQNAFQDGILTKPDWTSEKVAKFTMPRSSARTRLNSRPATQ